MIKSREKDRIVDFMITLLVIMLAVIPRLSKSFAVLQFKRFSFHSSSFSTTASSSSPPPPSSPSSEFPLCKEDIPYEEDDKEEEEGEESPIIRKSMRIKVRQHVNPLAAQYQVPVTLEPDWIAKAFADPSLPFVVDIGCAKGGFPLQYATQNPVRNVLGLEIRRPVVQYCLQRKAYKNLTNVHFLAMNANIDLKKIFEDISFYSSVELVTLQFPDPHFKARHKKRRVVNVEFVDCTARNLKAFKKCFIQTDIEELAEYRVEIFDGNELLEADEGFNSKMLNRNPNPIGIETEREVATKLKGQDVYRMMYVKKSE